VKVLLYADFRSPHARGWQAGLTAAGIDVLAVSSEPVVGVGIVSPLDSVSRARQSYVDSGRQARGVARSIVRRLSAVQSLHSVLQLVRKKSRRRALLRATDQFKPDLVHALRLPYEGITALSAHLGVPIVVSSWGSDFIPQARQDPIIRAWLRKHLPSADGYQYDSPADLRRALDYGLPSSVPSIHTAGNFGVDESLFYASDETIPGLVVYARKVTPNSNYFGFVEAALKLMNTTDATFIGVGLDKIGDEVTNRFGEYDHTRLRLTGELDREEFARTIRSAHVVVSPSHWDGMPNTILEAAASGARIVAGELPQLRALAGVGIDIDLIDAGSSDQIAQAIERQLLSQSDARVAVLPNEYSRSQNVARVRSFYDAVLVGSRV
jgi:glycosyltransferase involved in cell wall biosynthesis